MAMSPVVFRNWPGSQKHGCPTVVAAGVLLLAVRRTNMETILSH
jgi:hypothetical protein